MQLLGLKPTCFAYSRTLPPALRGLQQGCFIRFNSYKRGRTTCIGSSRATSSQGDPVATVPTSAPSPAAPKASPSWTYISAMLVISVAALQLSRQLVAKYFAAEAGESAASQLQEAAAAAPGGGGGGEAPQESQLGGSSSESDDIASMPPDELQATLQATRIVAQSLDLQLLSLQNQVAAKLPSQSRQQVEDLLASIEEIEHTLAGMWKGDRAVPGLEQRQQGLQWELFAAMQPGAGAEEQRAYRSLLSNLCLQRQLLVALEAREALLGMVNQGSGVEKGAQDAATPSLMPQQQQAGRGKEEGEGVQPEQEWGEGQGEGEGVAQALPQAAVSTAVMTGVEQVEGAQQGVDDLGGAGEPGVPAQKKHHKEEAGVHAGLGEGAAAQQQEAGEEKGGDREEAQGLQVQGTEGGGDAVLQAAAVQAQEPEAVQSREPKGDEVQEPGLGAVQPLQDEAVQRPEPEAAKPHEEDAVQPLQGEPVQRPELDVVEPWEDEAVQPQEGEAVPTPEPEAVLQEQPEVEQSSGHVQAAEAVQQAEQQYSELPPTGTQGELEGSAPGTALLEGEEAQAEAGGIQEDVTAAGGADPEGSAFGVEGDALRDAGEGLDGSNGNGGRGIGSADEPPGAEVATAVAVAPSDKSLPLPATPALDDEASAPSSNGNGAVASAVTTAAPAPPAAAVEGSDAEAPPAAGAGVGTALDAPPALMVAAGVSLPHPRKADTGGEDAFFVSEAGMGTAGVADGVGGWALEGIDPALYPRQLLSVCEDALALHETPMEVLVHAHERANAPGSCTVCLAALQEEGVLQMLTLGDCGMVVVREGEGVVFRAEVQEHQFNMPYQMASPDFLPGCNQPEEAHQYEVPVQRGDVLVMGSDGLFDNLWEEDLRDLVHGWLKELPDMHPSTLRRAAPGLAQLLARRAHTQSQDPSYRSPFAVERHERMVHPLVRGVTKPQGGKMDDVTVVVGVMC